MSAEPDVTRDPSTATESVFVVTGEVPPDTIAMSLHALLRAQQHPIARRRFTVLDTFDGRVRRAGARLTRGGLNGTSTMLWQPRGGHGDLTIRLKEPASFAWDLPDGPLQQALTPVIGVRRLIAQADVERSGSLLEVLDDRGKTVARLRIESGRVRFPIARTACQTLPTMITLIGLRGYEDVYAQLVHVIESRPGIESCDDLHGLTPQERGGSDRDGSSADVPPTVTADVGARQIHQALLRLLVANEPGLRANLDTEFLHDFRVALRRTRSLLGQIKLVFPADVTEHFSTEFSWMGGLTGPMRDIDVLYLSLRERQQEVSASDMAALTDFFGQVQQQEQRKVVEALDSVRYRSLLAEWQAFLDRPGPSELRLPNAGRLLIDVVSARAWRLSRRIAESAWMIDERTEAARFHDVRIDAKKLRYLVDATPAFYDAADLERILDALKKLQRLLGDFNDAHVQQTRLLECGRTLAAGERHAAAAAALGRLAEQCRQRHERLRERVIDGLHRFRARETQVACRRAFKTTSPAEHSR